MEKLHMQPGLFELSLVINRSDYVDVEDQASIKIPLLKKYLQMKLQRSERHAIRNLLGVITARLGHYDEAMNYFRQIESEDPTNLNALANRQSLCKILCQFREANECANHLEMLQTTSKTTNTKGIADEVDLQKRKARCLAEQAYAVSFEIYEHDSIQCHNRYLKAQKMYFQALALAGELVDMEERQDWEFGNAIACMKIYKYKKIMRESYDNYFGYLDTSLWHFHRSIQSGDAEMQSASWRHIGEIFASIKPPMAPPNCINDHPDLQIYFEHPRMCIEKALQITPLNPQLLTRLAKMIRCEDVEESLRLLDQAITIDNSRWNRLAFALRGEIHLQLYRTQIYQYGNNDHKERKPPDRNLLCLAENDIDMAVSLEATPTDYTNLAHIWHYRAKTETGFLKLDTESKDSLGKALSYFTKALNCKNGANRQYIHTQRGICLLDAKEYDAAIGSFERAIECQTNETLNPFAFFFLTRVYLTKISELRSKKLGTTELLTELARHAKEAVMKYGKDKLQTKAALRLWDDMPQEMDMFVCYCNMSGYHLVYTVFSEQKIRSHIAANAKENLVFHPQTFPIDNKPECLTKRQSFTGLEGTSSSYGCQ